jgi:hypothetical protein
MPKLLLTLIDWEYPEDGKRPTADVWDLKDESDLMRLYMAFANGIIVELKAVGDSQEAIDVLRGLAGGAGSGYAHMPTEEEKARLWLCEDGYECYKQGSGNANYIFIHPKPQPEKFGPAG